MEKSIIMGPRFINGKWCCTVFRPNGTKYNASSESYQAMIDYREEFFEFQRQRSKNNGK